MKQLKKVWPLFVPEAPAPWEPLVDVYRARDGWVLKFDLAGVQLEDVTITVQGRFVSLSGLRRDQLVEEGASYYSMEISYNRFERTVEMPVSLENARVTIQARDGILLVRMSEEGKNHGR